MHHGLDLIRRFALPTSSAAACSRPTEPVAHGVIFGPAYSGMNLTTLDGGAQALQELGLLEAATP